MLSCWGINAMKVRVRIRDRVSHLFLLLYLFFDSFLFSKHFFLVMEHSRLLGTLDMWHWTHWIISHCTTHAVHPQNYSLLGQFSIAYTPSRIFWEETSEPRWNQHRYSWIEPGTQKCQCFLQNHCLTRTYLYIKSKLWICTFFMRSGSTEQIKQSSELEINKRKREEKLTVNFFPYILKM